jgi:hypothetical protein
MKLEAEYKSLLIKQARNAGAYARRIEDKYAVGILDIVVIPTSGRVYFIEGKRIAGNLFHPTERQWVEGQRIIQTRGYARPMLVGWDKEGQMHIAHGWPKQADKRQCWSSSEGNYYNQLTEYLDHVGRQP